MGLLDGLFGGQFSPDPSKDEAARMALLAASLGMLTSKGKNFGDVAGKAGLLGLGAYGNQLESARKNKQLENESLRRDQDSAMNRQLHQAQLEQYQAATADKRRAAAQAEQERQWMLSQIGQQPPGGMPGGPGAQPGPQVDPRTLPSFGIPNAPQEPQGIPQGNGVETFPVGGPEAGGREQEMARLMRQSAQGERLPQPQSPEQQLLAAHQKRAQQKMMVAAQMGDRKAFMEAKAELESPVVLDDNKRYILPGGGSIEPRTKPEAMTTLEKLIAARDRPGNERNRAIYDSAIEKEAERDTSPEWRLFKQQTGGTYAEFIAQQKGLRAAGAMQVNVGKETPPQVVKELAELSGDRDQLTRLVTGFKPDFGGDLSETVGRAKNEIGMRMGDESGRAQWWQEYQDYTNRVRNRLFGSALTPTEKREFDRAMVHPGMAPSEIKKNLERQQRAVSAATNKLANVYGAGTYNKDQIEKATAPTSPPSSDGWKIERVQ
jgi:hypothetical protein